MIRAQIAGHPLHPALVHFPVGLWLAAVLWDLVGWWKSPGPLWWQMSYWCLALGLVAALPTIATGVLEFLAIEPGDAAIDTATMHMMAMLSAAAIFGASWVLRAKAGAATAPTGWALALAFVGAAVLAVGGWLGGTLVYRHGIGRERERGCTR
jgi:uncharacterized membrane protein